MTGPIDPSLPGGGTPPISPSITPVPTGPTPLINPGDTLEIGAAETGTPNIIGLPPPKNILASDFLGAESKAVLTLYNTIIESIGIDIDLSSATLLGGLEFYTSNGHITSIEQLNQAIAEASTQNQQNLEDATAFNTMIAPINDAIIAYNGDPALATFQADLAAWQAAEAMEAGSGGPMPTPPEPGPAGCTPELCTQNADGSYDEIPETTAVSIPVDFELSTNFIPDQELASEMFQTTADYADTLRDDIDGNAESEITGVRKLRATVTADGVSPQTEGARVAATDNVVGLGILSVLLGASAEGDAILDSALSSATLFQVLEIIAQGQTLSDAEVATLLKKIFLGILGENALLLSGATGIITEEGEEAALIDEAKEVAPPAETEETAAPTDDAQLQLQPTTVAFVSILADPSRAGALAAELGRPIATARDLAGPAAVTTLDRAPTPPPRRSDLPPREPVEGAPPPPLEPVEIRPREPSRESLEAAAPPPPPPRREVIVERVTVEFVERLVDEIERPEREDEREVPRDRRLSEVVTRAPEALDLSNREQEEVVKALRLQGDIGLLSFLGQAVKFLETRELTENTNIQVIREKVAEVRKTIQTRIRTDINDNIIQGILTGSLKESLEPFVSMEEVLERVVSPATAIAEAFSAFKTMPGDDHVTGEPIVRA